MDYESPPHTWIYSDYYKDKLMYRVKTKPKATTRRFKGKWYFTEFEAKRSLPRQFLPEHFYTEVKSVQIPNYIDLLKVCYIISLFGKIDSLIVCKACYERLSKHHPLHFNGCQSDNNSRFKQYKNIAHEQLNSEDIFQLYNSTRQVLNIPVISALLEFDILFYMRHQILEAKDFPIIEKHLAELIWLLRRDYLIE